MIIFNGAQRTTFALLATLRLTASKIMPEEVRVRDLTSLSGETFLD
jgi:hypothetical protein